MTDLRAQLQSTLGDAYTIERELGGGGMSRVFLAQEHALKRKVVIKVLPSEATGALSVERFKREIQFAATLQQANIVPVLNAGETNGVPFYTMPYVEGESLRARLAVNGRFEVPEAIGLLKEIARALSHAHSKNVVHRDIKPDNVLVSSGSAMVTDFGIAKALSDSTTAGGGTFTGTGTTLGTPAYMSPEQASGDSNIDHRADIYAFGCLAYEMLTGSPPFAGQSPQAVIAAHLTKEPEPIERKRERLPKALVSLVSRCLAKAPAARPQSAIELVYALDDLAAPTPSNMPFSASRIRRGPFIAAAMFVVVGLAALAILPVLTKVKRPAAARLIVVLPFENASGDTAVEYLAEGMGDEVRSHLISAGLGVKARAASLAFRGRSREFRKLADTLNATDVVSGSVRAGRGRLHVTVEVIRLSDGSALWSSTFDEELGAFGAVQDSITRAIAASVRSALAGGSAVRAARPREAAAFDLYLRGRSAFNRGSEADLRLAISLYRQALERDSLMAEAHSGIAWAWAFLADAYVSPAKAYPETRLAAARALKIDSTIAEAWVALAMARGLHDWQFAEAAEMVRTAIKLNPQAAEFHSMLAVMLCGVPSGIPEAIAEARKAIALDPYSVVASWQSEYVYLIAGQYREAIAQRARTASIGVPWFYLLSGDGMGYVELGIADSAVMAGERDQKLGGGVAPYTLAFAYAAKGRAEDARRVVASLEAQFRNGYYPPEFIALAHGAIGNTDRAFQWLDSVFTTRSTFSSTLDKSRSKMWDPLRSDPRLARFRTRLDSARLP